MKRHAMREAIFKCGRPDSVILLEYGQMAGAPYTDTVEREARQKWTIYHCAFGAPLCGWYA